MKRYMTRISIHLLT